MALNTRVTRALHGKNMLVTTTKAAEKMNTSCRLSNPALAAPYCSLAPGGHKKKQVTRNVKVGLCFLVGQTGRYLKEGLYSQRIRFRAPVYIRAVLEYLTVEVLELAGQGTKDSKKTRIIPRHMMFAFMRDKELSKLLAGVTMAQGGMLSNIHSSLLGDLPMEVVTKSP